MVYVVRNAFVHLAVLWLLMFDRVEITHKSSDNLQQETLNTTPLSLQSTITTETDPSCPSAPFHLTYFLT